MHIKIERTSDAQHTVATDEAGNQVKMYLPEAAGGAATGIRPMQMLIAGLGGCTAVDVLTILKKQRQRVDSFHIDIEAEREPGKEPSLWQTAHLVFKFTGQVDLGKAEHAVQISMDKYCSVTETLRRGGTAVSWKVEVSWQ
jgi:putative redox protein